jgi:hypothetical protein
MRDIEMIDQELRNMTLKRPDPDRPGQVSASEKMAERNIENDDAQLPDASCDVCHRETTKWYPITLTTPPMNERGERSRIWGDMSRRSEPDFKGMMIIFIN